MTEQNETLRELFGEEAARVGKQIVSSPGVAKHMQKAVADAGRKIEIPDEVMESLAKTADRMLDTPLPVKPEALMQLTAAGQRKLVQDILWKIAEDLRGNSGLDASEFKSYPLALIFYKFLSEHVEFRAAELLKDDGKTFEEAWYYPELREALKEELLSQEGYYIEPKNLYRNLVVTVKPGNFDTTLLQKALADLEASTHGSESEQDFAGLFDDLDLNSRNLAATPAERNTFIGNMLLKIDQIPFGHSQSDIDVLGDAYEFMISQFAAGGGKTAGEFYTPPQVSKILATLVADGRETLESCYDPTAGSGSLLLRIAKHTKRVKKFYGQELNPTTYNFARMNMLLHGINFRNFEILNGNTLTNPLHIGKKFQAIVANPPYSANWTPKEDERFVKHGGLAPKSKADFAFVQHGLAHLADDGVFACVLPLGVLFRGAAEGKIRTSIIEQNLLHAVIALPANIFYGTSIPTCILVFRKDRVEDAPVLFVDASQEFVKEGNKNHLSEDAVTHLTAAVQGLGEAGNEAHYSIPVSREELAKNGYSCNVKLYVDASTTPEILIDLKEIRDALWSNGATAARLQGSIDSQIAQFREVVPNG